MSAKSSSLSISSGETGCCAISAANCCDTAFISSSLGNAKAAETGELPAGFCVPVTLDGDTEVTVLGTDGGGGAGRDGIGDVSAAADAAEVVVAVIPELNLRFATKYSSYCRILFVGDF